MFVPSQIVSKDFQSAWLEASVMLNNNGWELRNLVVHIVDPVSFDGGFHQLVSDYCLDQGLLSPKAVAYTIFPHNIYNRCGTSQQLFEIYNNPRGFYRRKYKGYWGTYFRRMTYYATSQGVVNQLENIINAINSRDSVHRAAYTIPIYEPFEDCPVIIQKPGNETLRPLGGPCLNYIAVQMQRIEHGQLLGLLCVYRNHDFLERAYGNYWGLCNLLCFLAKETKSLPGPLTCVSSHAYVSKHKGPFRKVLEAINGK